jgi:hypothetical protein
VWGLINGRLDDDLKDAHGVGTAVCQYLEAYTQWCADQIAVPLVVYLFCEERLTGFFERFGFNKTGKKHGEEKEEIMVRTFYPKEK